MSSSPWNLYGFIAEFMELHDIPHGPMFLKDYGIDRAHLGGKGHQEHKLAAIEELLSFYTDRRFLLIGDNGQQDVSIYAAVVQRYRERVAAVFIRDVDGSCRSGLEGELPSDRNERRSDFLRRRVRRGCVGGRTAGPETPGRSCARSAGAEGVTHGAGRDDSARQR